MNAMSQIPGTTAAPDRQTIDTYDARALIKDGVQACIVLDAQIYYLRITRAGKLILTK
ncbi:hemin uptake protein HemP [uncultured Tateyamaria sp.]|uniref:hemin uptake protein HemP n=1 Tax=uncultured Tateyamaria sp. TaxID=455651 RepID=UPI002623809D|nr:hemin uptake protein HemP [uncultured Tateyamaria sp.]